MLAAIETSFDDTGIAIADSRGRVLHSALTSQIAEHQPYRGVVPELAARNHIRDLPQLWKSFPLQTGVAPLSAIGVTAGPGLPGSLLAGVHFAAGLAAWHAVPLYGLNHLCGHIFSPYIATSDTVPELPLPHLALLVSGGHTELFFVRSLTSIKLLAQTRDDAVGELLDKVSALLGHGYPGGARLEQLAKTSAGLDSAARYHGPASLPVPLRGSRELCFSYSGLKTAVVRQVRSAKTPLAAAEQAELLACLFSVIFDSLWERISLALEQFPVKTLSVSGGVAINGLLRQRFMAECERRDIKLCLPQLRHCLDNAEMMVWLLHLYREAGLVANPFDIQSSWLPDE